MFKLKSLFISALLLAGATAFAQQITVTGVVTSSADGYGVIGAAVQEKGTDNGTITDFDGNFSLTVKEGAILVFSSIGYATLELPAQAQMSVVMDEDAQMLNEVVVTGYTVQRKADLTGAISTVNTADLAKQNENNPVKALQGRVPGMNISADGSPSGAAVVRIRGIGTLNDNDPLYIIDGVPTKAGMHELNGNDIESIQVLKDAASASIYGSRAANGVIIITTKGGKEGKVKVDFDASVAAQSYVNRMQVLNAEEFGRVMWQGYVNDGLNPDYMWPSAAVGEAEAYGGGGGFTLVSFFGKANYNFADRYLASVTVRYDGSSRFGRNNRFGLFPSVSLGWRIDKEPFMENATWLENLKIRASWGQTGNQEIANVARYTLYESNYGEAGFATSLPVWPGRNGGECHWPGFPG
ncbi:MAG: TonB-dependent receptor [Bacteroidales bacterium]|nr:TonB-dependent receptor [Bacteroidales bacterium]